MSSHDLSTDQQIVLSPGLQGHGRSMALMIGFGSVLLLFGSVQTSVFLRVMILTTGTALLLSALALWAMACLARRNATRKLALIAQVTQDIPSACLITDTQHGTILWANKAAADLLEPGSGAQIAAVLSGTVAAPEGVVQRLQDHALATGEAAHDSQIGSEKRSYRLQRLSDQQLLWRIERSRTEDSRDILPLALAQFDATGNCIYAAPALRDYLGQKPVGPEALFEDGIPEIGQTAAVAPPLAALGPSALRLQDVAAQTDTIIVMPEQIPAAPDGARKGCGPDKLDNMPVAIAHLSSDGAITYLNREARRLLQWPDGDRLLVSDILEGLGRPVMEWLSEIAEGAPRRATEVLRLTRGNCETYLKVTLVRPDDKTGPQTDVIAVLSDVTELKSLEAKFTQSQKMQAIGQLAGGVAHDFNNLLTAISGHCDLLLLRHDRSDLDYPDLMQIQQNTNRAAALVRQLLALSRQQTLKFVTLDLQETMDDVIHLLNRLVGEKITLTLHHGDNVAPIRSDKRQFEQVLMNLVVNARDALPMGGEIRIETESRKIPQGFAHDHVTLPPGDYTIIRIRDDGIGIPATLLPKIFDPFFTTKRPGEGTGLGLSTVYGIVKQSGGYIFAESEEGEGTTFTLYFKAQDREPERVQDTRRKLQGVPALKSRRALVLLVEDEAPVRSFAARALELQGHRVIEAECGEVALEILDNPDIRPDVFVTDVIMPGIDGPSWVERVRDRFPDTPVLFMSGYAEDSRVAAQSRISNAAFLGKPFSLSEFTSIVNERLSQDPEAA